MSARNEIDWKRCLGDLENIFPQVAEDLKAKILRLFEGAYEPIISIETYPPHIKADLAIHSNSKISHQKHRQLADIIAQVANQFDLRVYSGAYAQSHEDKPIWLPGSLIPYVYTFKPDYQKYKIGPAQIATVQP